MPAAHLETAADPDELPEAGPFDEAALLVALGLIAIFCRPIYREIRANGAKESSD